MLTIYASLIMSFLLLTLMMSRGFTNQVVTNFHILHFSIFIHLLFCYISDDTEDKYQREE